MTKARWCVNLMDFANMVKAFIGSNYLSVAYAFSQSGLALGIVGMLLIAGLTDHCCHLIVKTKHIIIEKCKEQADEARISQNSQCSSIDDTNSEAECTKYKEEIPPFSSESSSRDQMDLTVNDTENIEEYLFKHMTYGNVGKHCFGNKGLCVVNFFIALTQFGFCVGYFIFIGNTLEAVFPLRYCYYHPITHEKLCDTGHSNYTGVGSFTAVYPYYEHNATTAPNITSSTSSPPSTRVPTNITGKPWSFIREIESSAPSLMLLVASPLPIFLGFALVRSVRYLGVISVIANISILGGCVSVFGFLVDDFEVHTTIIWANWKTFFVFFGMVTAAFEGIGVVIPVESSMVGNRHLFSGFLHGAMIVLTSILATFGIMGYLKFGSNVEQMLNTNIPRGDPLSLVVNVGICFGILLTFPLQIFPVIEIAEKRLLTPGKLFGPDEEQKPLISIETGKTDEAVADITHIPDSVATWKRNVLRIIIVLCACGIAVALRDYFAYVSALIGSLGSSVLGYVLPCLFHLKVCWNDVHIAVKVKDICIMTFGILASIICVISVIQQFAAGTIAH